MDPKIKEFLDRISALESSRGKNTNHRTINSGIQKGTTAIGQYGLLPNSIQEELGRMTKDQTISPEAEDLVGAPQEDVRDSLTSNPQLEQAIASHLAQRILNNQGGNDLAAAYAWNNGSNLPPSRIDSNKLLTNPYVQKFTKVASDDATNKLNQENDFKEMARKRALELLGRDSDPSQPIANGTGTLQDPDDLGDVDKAIQNLQGIRGKKKYG